MNKVFLQLWEESNIKDGFLSDGCSLHVNSEQRDLYVSSIYADRDISVPEKYDRVVGECIEVFVTDKLYQMVENDKSVKLSESSFQNLLKFEEIIYNESKV